jgi:4'-phosphopantetheinyl transferase
MIITNLNSSFLYLLDTSFRSNNHHKDIFIFSIKLSDWEKNIYQLWECLSIQEKGQANEYFNQTSSNNYIISHGILRYILSYYIKKNPRQINFHLSSNGKPYLKNNKLIKFNMSHSLDYCVYIIGFKQEVGIDIEFHNNKINIQELSNLILTPIECGIFAKLENKAQFKLFFDLWTQKESIVKANGKGLTYPIDSLNIINIDFNTRICLDQENNKNKRFWYCKLLELLPNYSTAITTKYQTNQIMNIRLTNF